MYKSENWFWNAQTGNKIINSLYFFLKMTSHKNMLTMYCNRLYTCISKVIFIGYYFAFRCMHGNYKNNSHKLQKK